MKISEFVARLEEIKAEHGDLECVDSYDDTDFALEVVEGVLCIADKA